ncbi:MAG TPA: hypothetical protein PLJ23_04295, partial [Gemmatimonadales bacterium]|nr:hypothetical protein [Gemmatimonadales bacterium]
MIASTRSICSGLCGLLLPLLPLAAQATVRDTARLADLVVTATRVPASTAAPAATTVLQGDDL